MKETLFFLIQMPTFYSIKQWIIVFTVTLFNNFRLQLYILKFFIALLIYNSHILNFTHLNCATRCFEYIHILVKLLTQSISKHFHYFKKKFYTQLAVIAHSSLSICSMEQLIKFLST